MPFSIVVTPGVPERFRAWHFAFLTIYLIEFCADPEIECPDGKLQADGLRSGYFLRLAIQIENILAPKWLRLEELPLNFELAFSP